MKFDYLKKYIDKYKGQIVEKASHEALIDRKGPYYNLYVSQFEGKEEGV